MANLIDRDDALELFQGDGWLLESTIRRCIEDLTVIDAVPIVRCGDCRHRRKPLYPHPTMIWCPLVEHHHHPDWFCAHGKKEEK